MADSCEFCTHYIMDDELGNYCDVDLDEDEMEKFLTESVTQCHYLEPTTNTVLCENKTDLYLKISIIVSIIAIMIL